MPTEITTVSTEETVDTTFKKRDQILQQRGMNLAVWGSYGVGKTFLGFSFPEPIYVISTEEGVAQLLHHFPDKDIRIMECTESYTDAPIKKQTGKADDTPGSNDPEFSLRNIEKATLMLKDIKKGTILLDSGTDVWEFFSAWIDYNADKYTKSGQMMRTEWGKVNSKYKNIFMRLMSRPVNFVVTLRSQNIYNAEGRETTAQKFSGQKNTLFIPDIILHLDQKPATKVGADGKIQSAGKQRIAIVEKNRFGQAGQTIIDPTYDRLKEALKGEVPEGVFS